MESTSGLKTFNTGMLHPTLTYEPAALFSVGFPSAVIWLTSPQHLKDTFLKRYVAYKKKREFYTY